MSITLSKFNTLLIAVIILIFSVKRRAQVPVFGEDSNPFGSDESEDEQQLSIYMLSPVKFGTFYPGKTGGSIFIDENGIRTANGSVVLLGGESAASVFEISCPSYTVIHLTYESQIIMSGSNGGTLIFEPDDELRNTTIISPENAENGFLISIGGTLIVEDMYSVVPGNYSGNYIIGVNFE